MSRIVKMNSNHILKVSLKKPIRLLSVHGVHHTLKLKVAQDPCNHYVCIYLNGMHELRRENVFFS